MQECLNYWNFMFWFIFTGFLFNHTNFIMLIFFSEFMWIILYSLSILVGVLTDDLNSSSISFLILGVAGLEFSIGFLILLLFRSTNESYFLTKKELASNKSNLNTINRLITNQVNF
jgi:NADH:ubiquinone oxidoreductase subunit K